MTRTANWMRLLAWGVGLSLLACNSGSGDGDDAGPCKGGTVCEEHADCNRGEYCAASGCCLAGCAFDEDCATGEVCDPETHGCVADHSDGGPDDGGVDDGGVDDGGVDDGGVDDGGVDDGGADAGGDAECVATHDRALGEACECDGQCVAEAPYCFADVMNDPGPTYCTIPDCSAGTCPADYECNDFYTQADPPQPAFCQRCLGGERALGEDCLCDGDCGPEAPDCFKDLTGADEAAMPLCTITGCATGAADDCPAGTECKVSFDMASGESVQYCKLCDPGDHSLAAGEPCGCNIDCVEGAVCHKDPFGQDPAVCVECLGGEPRGFGEDCQCDADCVAEFPVCLPSNRYCSVYGCTEDPGLCPEGATCQDVFGMFSFCKRP